MTSERETLPLPSLSNFECMARSFCALFLFGVLGSRATVAAFEDDDADFDDYDIEESLTAAQLRAMHSKFDKDGNGKVSLSEVMSHAQEMGSAIAAKDMNAILEEVDTNKDGVLSLDEHMSDIRNQVDGGDPEELKELEERKRVETSKFRAADGDGNGVLNLKELPGLFYPETHDGVLSITVAETMRQKDSDKDGRLTPQEFWETDGFDNDDLDLSEEEKADFAKLDADRDGHLSLDELRAWESGRFHTEEAMKTLFEIADKDSDMHVTADELAEARELVASSDAQYHLIEWAEHHEV